MSAINRRQFLAAAGATAATAASALAAPTRALLPGSALSAAPVPAIRSARGAAQDPPAPGAGLAAAAHGLRARSLRKAAHLGMVQVEGTLREKFALLAGLGFDGVELDSPTDLDRDEVAAALAETGLSVADVIDSRHWSDTLTDPDAAVRARGVAALETALDDAAHWGCGSVLLVPGVVNKTVGYDQAWERSTAAIRQALPRAAERKVAIAIENVWNGFLLSPLEAARYVDQFESPWVGWHFDVGNVVNFGWPEQWIRILGPRTRCLHIKEFSRGKRDAEGLWKGFDVELLQGDCDWPAVMAALDAVGYAGWATIEMPGGDRQRLADLHGQLERILAS